MSFCGCTKKTGASIVTSSPYAEEPNEFWSSPCRIEVPYSVSDFNVQTRGPILFCSHKENNVSEQFPHPFTCNSFTNICYMLSLIKNKFLGMINIFS